MTVEQTMAYIHKTLWLGSKPGLERTRKLLSLMGNPQNSLKFVHVAGTNGKGSVCACIESILRNAGYKTGLYTSPYINVFNERMRVDGVNISDDELCEICEYIKPFADSMTEDLPTEFELITAFAMEYFARKKCDVVVLEVGMGGELDSTNIIEGPDACVITAIDLDHTAFLGDTVEKVAEAKAGIIKKGTDCIIYDGEKSVEQVFEEKCRKVGATLHKADFSKLKNERITIDKAVFDYDAFRDISLGLVGAYQPKNACVAIKCALVLRQKGYKISDKNIYDGLAGVRWQGRFEILGKSPVFVLDGAHNPHGMAGSVQSLKAHFGDKKQVFVVGAMADKDVSGMMSMLLPLAKCFFAVKPDNSRAMPSKELAELLRSLGAEAQSCDNVSEGVKKAIDCAGKDGIVACLGSLYFSGEIRKAYLAYRSEKGEKTDE